MQIIGVEATVTVQGPVTFYESARWPFGARVQVNPDGKVFGNISSGGYRLFEVGPVDDTKESVAAQLDAASKVIFAQAAWYQEP
jgi:hypothetical protein